MVRLRLTRHDALLVLMTVIWGGNYTVVKVALREIPPLAFNSLRLGLASLLFLATIAIVRPRTTSAGSRTRGLRPRTSAAVAFRLRRATPKLALMFRERRRDLEPRTTRITPRDWLLLAVYGVIGHFIYQLCFLFGLHLTTVANSSLILGCSPVVVAMMSGAVGHERVRAVHWIGGALSVAGIYLVIGHGASLGGATLSGDLLTIGGLLCWGVYTVGAKGLLDRYSPLEVTGYSMAFGTLPFVALALGELSAFDWRAVHASAWAALVFSGVFALYVSYLIWYAAVQRIGNIRTSMYSNLTPVSALLVAVLWLGEQWTVAKAVGAAAILAGMALARLVPTAPARTVTPAEE